MLPAFDRISVPAPFRVRPPAPPSTPDSVSVVPPFGLTAPPPSVTVRADVNVAVVWSVPPLSATAFAAAPRLWSALTDRVPLVSVTPPVNVFVPVGMSVPAPFSDSPPPPLSVPDSVSVVAAFGLITPPPSVTARADVNVAVVWSIPPFSARPPEPPRLLSAPTESVPAATVVPPVYVFAPLSTTVPPPTATPPVLPMMPEIVSDPRSPPFPSVSTAPPSTLMVPVKVTVCPVLTNTSRPARPMPRRDAPTSCCP